MKKKSKVVMGVIGIILLPVFIDIFVFGNKTPSNVSNDVWAGFLGSYIGGIATLVAVFITISDNNKKIREQKEVDKAEKEEQRKLSIKPYLDTRYNFFNQEVAVGENDRIFEIEEDLVQKVRYRFTEIDRKEIEVRQNIPGFIYLRYIIRNIGSGSAVDMKVIVNGFSEKIAIAKDESVNIFISVDLRDKKDIILKIELDYWDTERRANYYQNDSLHIQLNETEQLVGLQEHTYPEEKK